MKPKLIKTEAENEAALARLDEIFDAEPGTPEGDEAELLTALIEMFERETYPIDLPDPIEAIKFRMEQGGLKRKDLVPLIGSESKVSEVLSGKRPLSLAMIRNLVRELGIPAEVLLQEAGATIPSDTAHQQGKHFPIAEMLKRGWFPSFNGTLAEAKNQMEELLHGFVGALSPDALIPALNRQSVRDGGKRNEYALNAWRIRVANLALAESIPAYRQGTVNREFLRELATLSYLSSGPVLAREFLNKSGIHLVFEPQLVKTLLDGATLRLPGGKPVVALTLRHDRLDNFWFTLFHELAHVALHLEGNTVDAFFDDLSTEGTKEQWEREADELATNSLIPESQWQAANLTVRSSSASVMRFAEELRISPAIPAGRIRYQAKNYTILKSLIGTGTVRSMFGIKE